MYPLSISVSLERVANSVTPASRLKLPLLKFEAICKDDDDDVHFLAESGV
jgi:hypothetical protein